MESMTATSAEGTGTLAVPGRARARPRARPARANARRAPPPAPARRRRARALLAGVDRRARRPGLDRRARLVARVLALAWPVFAFVCGLHAARRPPLVGERRARGAEADARRAGDLLAAYGLFLLLDAAKAPGGALVGSLVVAAAAGAARATARHYAHRPPGLRQRTLIIGSGLVADQLVERLPPQRARARPDRLPRHGRATARRARHPVRSAASTRSRTCSRPSVDRVMIAFSRAGHEELLQCIRQCRDHGVAVDVVPRLFEFLDGARTFDQIGGMPLLSIAAPAFSRGSRRWPSGRWTSSLAVARADRARAAAARGRGRDQDRLARSGPVRRSADRAAEAGSSPSSSSARCRSARRSRCAGRRDRQVGRRRPHHARRPLHPALLARRGAAALQRPEAAR